MPENTSDDFEPASPLNPDEEAQPIDSTDSSTDETEEETPSTSESETEEKAPDPENMLPPEARGEVNGGPLGCCLGFMIGMLLGGVLLSLSLTILNHAFADYGLVGWLVRVLLGILAFVLLIFLCRTGWKLGKRFYREYEPPTINERQRRPRTKKVQQKI